jgi:hypothetical protein
MNRQQRQQQQQPALSSSKIMSSTNANTANTSSSLSSSQLRSRRSRIDRDQARDQREENIVKKHIQQSSQKTNHYMIRLYLVVGTTIIVTILALLNHTRPRFLYQRQQQRNKKQQRRPLQPFILGTMYPPAIIQDLDHKELPRFFQTLSIVTPENVHARHEVARVVHSRVNLRADSTFPVSVKVWDLAQFQIYLDHNICGPFFSEMYEKARHQGDVDRQLDLSMWCLLTTKVVEGFFLPSIDWVDSPIAFLKQRGMVFQTHTHTSTTTATREDNDQPRLSSSMYLNPRSSTTFEEESSSSSSKTMTAILPSKMLTWVLSNEPSHFESPQDYRRAMEMYLYELVHNAKGDHHFLFLEAHCYGQGQGQAHLKRSMAKECGRDNNDECCEFLLPESEGGHFDHDDDDHVRSKEEQEQSSLRN